jgi:hypothetical protein
MGEERRSGKERIMADETDLFRPEEWEQHRHHV